MASAARSQMIKDCTRHFGRAPFYSQTQTQSYLCLGRQRAGILGQVQANPKMNMKGHSKGKSSSCGRCSSYPPEPTTDPMVALGGEEIHQQLFSCMKAILPSPGMAQGISYRCFLHEKISPKASKLNKSHYILISAMTFQLDSRRCRWECSQCSAPALSAVCSEVEMRGGKNNWKINYFQTAKV